mgnify:CR=1 FL=1
MLISSDSDNMIIIMCFHVLAAAKENADDRIVGPDHQVWRHFRSRRLGFIRHVKQEKEVQV